MFIYFVCDSSHSFEYLRMIASIYMNELFCPVYVVFSMGAVSVIFSVGLFHVMWSLFGRKMDDANKKEEKHSLFPK